MDTFRHVLHELSGGKLTEQVFMNPENYGKTISPTAVLCNREVFD